MPLPRLSMRLKPILPKQERFFETAQSIPLEPTISGLSIEEIKERGFRDYEFFVRHFFDGKPGTSKYFWGDLSPVHEAFVELEKNPDRRGQLEVTAAPRGNAKTVFKVTVKTIHSIVYKYQPFTVIVGYSATEAENKVKDIRDELFNNTEIIRVFGPQIKKNAGVKDFTALNGCRVLARARGKQVRGLRHGEFRPTHIILDDVEDLQGTQTPEQREKTKNWLTKDVIPSGQGGDDYAANITFVGTILHEDSLLANLLVDPSWNFSQKFKSILKWSDRKDLWDEWKRIYCELSNPKRMKDAEEYFKAREDEMLKGTQVLWPDGESYYKLMRELLKLGTAGFYSEKQNEPFDPERQILNPDLCARFKVYTPSDPEWRPEKLGDAVWAIVRSDNGRIISSREASIVGFLDPALGKKNSKGSSDGDYAAITILAQDLHGFVYALESYLKKSKPSEYINQMFALAQKWNVERMYLEQVGAFALLDQNIKDEQTRWTRKLNCIGVDQHTNKIARITSMQPYFQNGWLSLNENINPEFIDQIRLFPTVHDDGPDSLEGGLRQLKHPLGSVFTSGGEKVA